MAGSGIALRIHEFKDTGNNVEQLKQISGRHGRDVEGIYPGQIARVHNTTTHSRSSKQRISASCLKENFERSYNFMAVQASLSPINTSNTWQPLSTYQLDFSSSNCVHNGDVQKFTPSSHPAPLDPDLGELTSDFQH